MQYKVKATGEKLRDYDLIASFPNISFGFPITPDIMDLLGLVSLPDDAPPEPLPYVPPEPLPYVPPSATRKQARKALALAGLFDAVQPAIDAIEDPLERLLAQIDWDDAQYYERSDPFLTTMVAALGLDAAALDELFVTAAGL